MLRRLAIFGLPIVAIAALMLAMTGPPPPTFADVRAQWRPSEAQLLDRNGDPVHELRIDRHGRRFAWTSLDEISPALTEAIVASEDHRFWSHHGVDLIAIATSAARGASWRTQPRCEHDHDATRVAARSLARKIALAQNDPSEIQTNLCGARARTSMVETGNPRSLPEPCHLPRRIAGRRRRVARDVRQSATRNRLRRGRGAGRFDPGAECAPRIRRDSCERAEPRARIVGPIASRDGARRSRAHSRVAGSDYARVALAPHLAERLLQRRKWFRAMHARSRTPTLRHRHTASPDHRCPRPTASTMAR